MDLEAIAARYRRFAALEAAGRSPLYQAAAEAVAADPELLELLAGLPEGKQQPNLLFASLRHCSGLAETAAVFLAPAKTRWAEIAAVMRARSTQTNEPGRCATLLPLLARLPQPLALLEVGASAGLCLLPDRYGYDYVVEGRHHRLLPPDAGPDTPVFPCQASASMPLPEVLPRVVWRAGLDLNPLDLTDPEACTWLETLVWPGQDARAGRLAQAIAVARRDPPRVICADLNAGLAALAAEAPAEATLVIFHSAVLAYLPEAARLTFRNLVEGLDAVWISNEGARVVRPAGPPADDGASGFLAIQDGQVLARTDPHGASITWLG